MRASTTAVPGPYDPYNTSSRLSHDAYPSDTGYPSGYGYRATQPSIVEAHPVSSHRIQDPTASTPRHSEYGRNRSNTTSSADYGPSRLEIPTSRQFSAPYTAHERTVSPVASDSQPNVILASPKHPAHLPVGSKDYASDTGRRDSPEYLKYRTSRDSPDLPSPSYPRRHYAHDGPGKGGGNENSDSYSYTNAHEQFDRDYPIKERTRGHRSSTDRPLSMSGVESVPHLVRKKHPGHSNAPTLLGIKRIPQQGGSLRGREDRRDADRLKDESQDQALVVAPHDSDEDYSRPAARHHRRNHDSDRDRHTDHHSKGHNVGSLGVIGLGAAALAGGYSDASDYEQHHSSKRTHRRSYEDRDKRYANGGYRSSRELVASPDNERSSQTFLDPADAHRHGRRRHSRQRPQFSDMDTSDDDLQRYRREEAAPGPYRRRPNSSDRSESERDRSSDRSRHHRKHRDRSRGHRTDRSRHHLPEDDDDSEPRRSRYDRRSRDGPRRRLEIVDPPINLKEVEAPPRSILKAPRQAFPEEPNPVREGVAPLKDATKPGIPTGARWTKIDRRLVNPEALEAGNERFEERSDYVIVLRVLSKEDIQAYASKTQEIRGKSRFSHARVESKPLSYTIQRFTNSKF